MVGIGEFRGFICDEMLGKLTRWLRMIGYDTLYPRGKTDRDLSELSVSEKRVLLTRDRDLACMRDPLTFFIKEEKVAGQIGEMVELLKSGRVPRGTTRCPMCNGVLSAVQRCNADEFIEEIPDRVKEKAEVFYTCGGCGKVYWEGTHTDSIKKILNRYDMELILPKPPS